MIRHSAHYLLEVSFKISNIHPSPFLLSLLQTYMKVPLPHSHPGLQKSVTWLVEKPLTERLLFGHSLHLQFPHCKLYVALKEICQWGRELKELTEAQLL